MKRLLLLTVLLLCGIPAMATAPTLVQHAAWGTNSTGKAGAVWSFSMPHPTQANNLLICGASWDTTTITLTITDDQSNIYTAGPTSNDGTRNIALRYVLGVAASTQKLTFTFSTAANNVHVTCSEYAFVATSAATDGSCSTSNVTGPTVACGSFTTTVDGDLIFYYAIDDFCCNSAITAVTVGSNFNKLSADRRGTFIAHAEQYTVQTTHGAINPTMTFSQTANDTFGSAAIAFKPDATKGTAPTGIRIVRMFTITPSATSFVTDLPCSGNLMVAGGTTQPAQADITGITDTDSNTWVRKSSTGNPQILYAQNETCTSPNTRTATVSMSNVTTADPIVFYDISGAATSAFDSTMGVVLSGSRNQTHYTTSSTVCSNAAATNSTMNATPSTTSGIIIVVENNGTGPECGVSSTNNVLDSAWFQSEDDACCGTLNSSSGYAHIFYSSASQQTITFNWANCLNDPVSCGSGTAPGSAFAIAAAAFAAPASSPSISKRAKLEKLDQ